MSGLTVLGPAGSSSAEECSLPAPGTTIRLAIDGQAGRLAGRLVSADAVMLVLQPSEGGVRRAIPRDTVVAVDVAARRPLLGFGAGVLVGAASGLLLAIGTHDDAVGAAVAGSVVAVPPAALGAVLGRRERATARAALAGAAVDGLALGILLDGWCQADGRTGCFLYAALLGGAFGAVSGGIAAHVSRRRWTRAWSRSAQIGVVPARGRGAGVVVRLGF